MTDGLTGSEIENALVEALYAAFDDGNEPTDLTIAQVLTEFVPLSKLIAEQITSLRNWANADGAWIGMPETLTDTVHDLASVMLRVGGGILVSCGKPKECHQRALNR
jgi:hypothetical protein